MIELIRKYGWTEETKKLVRKALVNVPVGRATLYSVQRCFHADDVSAEEVVKALQEMPTYDRDTSDTRYFSNKRWYATGNVLVAQADGEKMHREFHAGEMIEFWCGTSKARAEAFLSRGNGYVKLECAVESFDGKTQYGIQVMLEDFRAFDYARNQAFITMDRPYVIHGLIPVECLFPANNWNEYSIPWFYYDRIMELD